MDADVEVMALRYSLYREGNDTLAAMAYFCLTVLQQAANGRDRIPSKFGVQLEIAGKLGYLTSKKGGALEARKANGRPHAYAAGERSWIEQAIKKLIRRAAEIAHDPASAKVKITMADLPKL